jgi:hypothetical protein
MKKRRRLKMTDDGLPYHFAAGDFEADERGYPLEPYIIICPFVRPLKSLTCFIQPNGMRFCPKKAI